MKKIRFLENWLTFVYEAVKNIPVLNMIFWFSKRNIREIFASSVEKIFMKTFTQMLNTAAHVLVKQIFQKHTPYEK